MTRQNIPLGRILGIPVGLDYSWFLIFALFKCIRLCFKVCWRATKLQELGT
jgi:hypothetical protein